jgi:hypothetical protein
MEARETRARNRVFKARESARRDRRMMEEIQARGLPYSPVVMSWLSGKLSKPARKITSQDVQSILESAAASGKRRG